MASIQIETETMEKSVNRVIQVLEQEFNLSPMAVAFVLNAAKDHVQEFHGFRLHTGELIPRCSVPGCQQSRIAYTQFCQSHQLYKFPTPEVN